MKHCISYLAAFILTGLLGIAQAATITVTTASGTGAGSLTAAINALANGDTIAFAIPGAGPHYIQTPPDGFPLITKNNVTIDGYSQPGASPNTASIHAANNAVLKIVLTSTNGNALSMQTACETSWGSPIPNLGYGDDEQAILGFFHATNATIQGLVIQSAPLTATTHAVGSCKAICFAANSLENGGGQCQNWQISGCWFGVDPVTRQVAYMPDGVEVATPRIAFASYRTRNVVGGSEPTWNYNHPGTIGVPAGAANPRAAFNVIVTGYGFDAEGKNWRASGNFWNVLPDGVTTADMSVLNGGVQLGDGYLECGRNNSGIIVGTDGDGVNDADEGNIFGPFANSLKACMDFYSPNGNAKDMVIAGNYFNADINGNSLGANLGRILGSIANASNARFGSDFNGVSDAWEANKVFNWSLFTFDGTWPTNTAWLSMRGNSIVNCTTPTLTRPPLGDGQTGPAGQNTYAQFIDTTGAGGTLDIIPVITSVSPTSLSGTCGKPLGAPYTRVVVDLYAADTTALAEPQGSKWLASFTDNSAADSNPAIGAFTFNISSLGLTPGTKVTITANYLKTTSNDGQTSPFSDLGGLPVTPTTVTTTNATGPGSLTAAINALTNGATLYFAIDGAGPHYIQTPPDGFPLITKNNVTIDGYSQAGASPNTASIHAANNAVLKIVLSSTNGNALSMQTACETSWGSAIPNLGYGDDEQAILGFFHATNATIKGLVIQAAPLTATTHAVGSCKAICFAANSLENGGGQCQNWQISGCWFGVDPVTRQVAYMPDGVEVATPRIAFASYRTRNVVGGSEPTWNYNHPGTIGVPAGAANPRAAFNVIVTGYGFDAEGKNWRASGNFWNVLPDGVTTADMSVLNGGVQLGDGYLECGRNNSGIIVGTDGDGVNDADEGNIFGPFANSLKACMDFYSPNGNAKDMVIAGNYFNADINGNSLGANLGRILGSIANASNARFGSDFNGVSDAWEANKVFNWSLFTFDGTWPTNTAWLSMRGNSIVNCTTPTLTRPPLGDGQTGPAGQNTYAQFIDTTGAGGTLDIIPVIGAGTTTTALTGTCGKPLGALYTRVVVDLYVADTTALAEPQGSKWLASFTDNSAADSNPAVGAFTFSTAGLGITSGTKVTIAVTYSKDTQPTLGSVSRVGTQTTLSVAGGTGPTYGIQKSSAVSGPYTFAAATVGGSATFTDNNPVSFYRATGAAASGQTSPYSDLFTIP